MKLIILFQIQFIQTHLMILNYLNLYKKSKKHLLMPLLRTITKQFYHFHRNYFSK